MATRRIRHYAGLVIEDREIWACAKLLLEKHGDDAGTLAARRAEELGANGDLEGRRTFLRIVDRIAALNQVPPTRLLH